MGVRQAGEIQDDVRAASLSVIAMTTAVNLVALNRWYPLIG